MVLDRFFDVLLTCPDGVVQQDIRYIHLEFQGEIWIACACLKDNNKHIVIETTGVN